MGETRGNGPRSALADGAERLARLARTVREQNIAEVQGLEALAVTNVYSLSPDEVWSKKYMSQGIGPMPDCAKPGGFCPVPFGAIALDQTAVSETVAVPKAVAVAPAFAQIGQSIGKPYRKRSWFGR